MDYNENKKLTPSPLKQSRAEMKENVGQAPVPEQVINFGSGSISGGPVSAGPKMAHAPVKKQESSSQSPQDEE